MRWRRPSRASIALGVVVVSALGAIGVLASTRHQPAQRGAPVDPLGPMPSQPLTVIPLRCAPIDLGGVSKVRFETPIPCRLAQDEDRRLYGRDSGEIASPREITSHGHTQAAGGALACAVVSEVERLVLLRLLARGRAAEGKAPAASARRAGRCDLPEDFPYEAWTVWWTSEDGHDHRAWVTEVGRDRATLESLVRSPTLSYGPYGPPDPESPLTPGTISLRYRRDGSHGRNLGHSTYLTPDGRHPYCRFDATQASRFCAWMTARGWAHVTVEDTGFAEGLSEAEVETIDGLWGRIVRCR